MPLPTTHLIIARTDKGETDIIETPVGTDLRATVAFLAQGQVSPFLTVVSVFAVAFPGESTDVTAHVLNEVAVHCEAALEEVPANLHAAFAIYDVPLPVQPPADWADVEAEHRLTADDLGIERRAA